MIAEISKMALPPIYKRNGKECYLDPIRKKLIYITPEETVRQRVVAYLLNVLKVPADMLIVESHLAHYKLDSKRRADIVIHAINAEGMLYPIAIVECKAPDIKIDRSVIDQATRYNMVVGARYIILTNGLKHYCFELSPEGYRQMQHFHKFE